MDPHVPIVFLSSSAVYGRSQNVNEDSATGMDANDYDDGVNGYASGKYLAEQILLNYDQASSGTNPCLIVRPFNVVGPGQTGDYGMVLPRLVRAAVRDEPLVVYGDGTQVRSFAHVETFLDVLMALVHANDGLNAWTSYLDPVVNIGSPVATTINDLAKTVQNQSCVDSKIEYVPYETVYPGHRDVQYRVPDLCRLRRMLEGPPIQWPSVEQIVQDVLRHEYGRL
jgi:UDP-glucose 4-epimerase